MTDRLPVPFNDLHRHWAPVASRLEAVVTRVVRSGRFLLGHETEAFESAFAEFTGVHGCVAVANGTDAIELALRAVACEAGDEVIVAPNAGMYSTTACVAIGAVPVFADVDAASQLVSVPSVTSMITDRTRAVVTTHLYGNVVDIDELRRHMPAGVAIVEDAAQAHGASLDGRPVGSLGDIAAFSFYPTKNLGALGDAGAIVSDDPNLLERARALRQYGWEQRYVSTVRGGRNSRIDEIQAAVLREFLPDVAEWNERRATIRSRYVDALSDRLAFVGCVDARVRPATHLCVARTVRRDDVIRQLAARGVACEVHYPVADHMQPALATLSFRMDHLVEAERACNEVMSLPCFPRLTDEEIETVIDAVGHVA